MYVHKRALHCDTEMLKVGGEGREGRGGEGRVGEEKEDRESRLRLTTLLRSVLSQRASGEGIALGCWMHS